MFDENFNTAEGKHQTLMHELGHALSIGWADDEQAALGECYSGTDCPYGVGKEGGKINREFEPTPEYVSSFNRANWPVMGDARYVNNERTAISIEEITTVDLTEIPTADD